jgi:hypothetical protein
MFSHCAARVGPTNTYIAFTPGCAGTMRSARLVPRDTPRIGSTFEVNLFDLPASAAIMAFGWSATTPQPLAAFGMPNCALNISTDAAIFVSGQLNTATWRLPIPNMPSLVGLRFYNQAFVLDPAANALGLVMSDAAEAVIGHW